MRALLLLVFTACASTPAYLKPAGEWRCWQRDPSQPNLPQGDVLFQKHRMVDGRLELHSVHEQNAQRGATRLALQPSGDHLEATLEDVTTIVRLDSSGWTLHSASPGLEFIEVVRIEDGVMTVTSIDQEKTGATTTAVRFQPTDCKAVDAELAQLK